MTRTVVAAVFAAVLLAGTPVQAGTFVAEVCWQQTPFEDIARCKLSYNAGSVLLLEMHCAVTSSLYEDMATGTMFISEISPGVYKIGLNYAHDGSSYDGCTSLTETVELDAAFTGVGTLVGAGPPDCTFGSSEATWTLVACPTGAAPAKSGTARGESK